MKKEEITTLVQKIRNKDNNAIGELVYRDIYFTAYKVLKNKEDAEDIVHDSFIICMKKIDTLKDDTAFLTFINRTVMNKSLNHLRDSKFELSDVTVNADGEEVVMDIEDTSNHANVEKVISDTETQRMVMEIIDKLPELQRMTIMLFYYEDFNISDIAKIMGCSDNTVKSRLNYARKTIKAEVEKLRKKYGDDILVVVPFLGKLIKAAASTEVPQDLSVATTRILEECAAMNIAAKEGKAMMIKNKIMERFVKNAVKNTTKSLVIKGLGVAAGVSVLTGATLVIAENNNSPKKEVTVSADTTSTQAVASNKSVQAVKPESTTEVNAVESESTEEATEVTEGAVENTESAVESKVESKNEESVVEATEEAVAVEGREEAYSPASDSTVEESTNASVEETSNEEVATTHEHDWTPVYTMVHHDTYLDETYEDVTVHHGGYNEYRTYTDPDGNTYWVAFHIEVPDKMRDCVADIDGFSVDQLPNDWNYIWQYTIDRAVDEYEWDTVENKRTAVHEVPAYDEEVVDHYECSCGATKY